MNRLTPVINRLNSILIAASKRQDIVLVAIVVTAVFMMILPLPTVLVDILIAINIMLSVTALTIAIYIRNPLEFSAFPALLLITTLYRLALTITTSRLVLLQHDAGEIVYAFGNFVVAGNVAVGIIIFTIITVVQFIVITKGAERVAEVSARFSLDGMPGRQMSIDGDMRAGVLSAEEAKSERELLQKESRLFGAMDGAMKFVKGDAIASIIVVLVNIIGGIAIGVMQHNMSASQAVGTYAILSVGDGLIAQIPALLISITAGLIVTRIPNAEQQNLATQMTSQLTGQPWALLMAGGVMAIFALIPGFPPFIFGGLAALAIGFGLYIRRTRAAAARGSQEVDAAKDELKTAPAPALLVRLGPKAAQRDRLATVLEQFRREKFDELGLPLPLPIIVEAPELPPYQVEIQLYLVPVVTLTMPEAVDLVWAKAQALHIDAQEYSLPWGVTLSWLPQEHKDIVTSLGLTTYSHEERISALLGAVVARYAEDFVGLQETRALLNSIEKNYPELLRELLRAMTLQKISEIMRRLVSEGVPIRDLRSVCEALADWANKEKDIVLLTEYVRITLRRQICHVFGGPQRRISVLLIGERIENMIRDSIRETSAGTYAALDADKTSAILELLRRHINSYQARAEYPVLLTAMDVRRYLRKMIEREFFSTPVLSTQELMEDLEVNVLGSLELFDEDRRHALA
ncbi:type III secretion system component [Mycoavidus cysteinexigens]|uniref:Type III secretion system component n=1 Tax=Mycoavidus cysteinexigens TaxID=1553431 RepID=A0A2Z6ESG3_9BURK|nr:type III secretion system export apparatus subunit SctV [Mycoavidus cysteinexigens]BBE08349.1 type III secretion system component [Mycoavidus cysteinexigens]GLR00855.1 secretion system apparatus protein SsaV [Mycoavidus cysteinexigens]